MDEKDHVTIGEHTRAMAALERLVTAGFERLDDGVTRLAELTREQGERQVAFMARTDERLTQLELAERTRTRKASAWASAAGIAVAAILEGFRRAFN